MRTLITSDRFTVWFSRRDISTWLGPEHSGAVRSVLAGHRLALSFSARGLEEIEVDGRSPRIDIPNHELSALLVDHLRTAIPREHPAYFTAVGQFIEREGGYVPCSCRDCFEIAVGRAGLALCGECEDAGCDRGLSECRVDVDFDACGCI